MSVLLSTYNFPLDDDTWLKIPSARIYTIMIFSGNFASKFTENIVNSAVTSYLEVKYTQQVESAHC